MIYCDPIYITTLAEKIDSCFVFVSVFKIFKVIVGDLPCLYDFGRYRADGADAS